MMKTYKCIDTQVFEQGRYKIVPIRDADKYPIRVWRNEQIEILRQKQPLTIAQQEAYFENVVAKLFEQDQPPQLLWSFLANNELIGYGGLVHIDWESRIAEISFLTQTSRNDPPQYNQDFDCFLKLLIEMSIDLNFYKLFAYGYDLRAYAYKSLIVNGFEREATLKNHVLINEKYCDVVIHSKFL
jgi:Acetyltransferase (GNAT) domain